MNRVFIFFSFLMMSTLSFHSSNAYAVGDCTLCTDPVGATPTLQCRAGHEVHVDCLANQLNSTEINSLAKAREIRSQGLACHGAGGQCPEKLSMQGVERMLRETPEFKNLITRLSSAESCTDVVSGSSVPHG